MKNLNYISRKRGRSNLTFHACEMEKKYVCSRFYRKKNFKQWKRIENNLSVFENYFHWHLGVCFYLKNTHMTM